MHWIAMVTALQCQPLWSPCLQGGVLVLECLTWEMFLNLYLNTLSEAVEMAQWVRDLVANSEDLSLTPRTELEGKK